MSGFVYTPGYGPAAWQRYLAREHAARSAYLQTVQGAHHEYLTGPWPDRDSYQAVERSAWITYYTEGRAAWQTYQREMEPPPPPPARTTDQSPAAARFEEEQLSRTYWADEPTFIERPERMP